MTDTCPVCGKGASDDPIPQDDGSTIGRINDHIPCVIAANQGMMRARELLWRTAEQRDRYRQLFLQANAEKRMWRDRAWRWIRFADRFQVFMIRYRDLFLKANQEKRDWRDVAMEYRVDFYNTDYDLQLFQELASRYRDLFKRANAAKRDYMRLFDAEHDVCEGEMGDSLYFQELASHYERLFKRANAAKRQIGAELRDVYSGIQAEEDELSRGRATVSIPPKPAEPPIVIVDDFHWPWQRRRFR